MMAQNMPAIIINIRKEQWKLLKEESLNYLMISDRFL